MSIGTDPFALKKLDAVFGDIANITWVEHQIIFKAEHRPRNKEAKRIELRDRMKTNEADGSYREGLPRYRFTEIDGSLDSRILIFQTVAIFLIFGIAFGVFHLNDAKKETKEE